MTIVNTYPISALASFSLVADSVSTIVPLVAAPAGTIYDWNTTAAAAANDWTAGVNWNPNGSPGFGIADIARFGKTVTIAAGNTVYLNRNQTIAQLVNQNSNAWTLAAGNPATSALTLNEITQSSSAAVTIIAAVFADSTSQLTFDGAGTGSVAITGMISGNTSQSGLIKVVKSSTGTVEVDGGLALATNSSLRINGGLFKININSGSAGVGSGVTATISGNSTLELAGSVSALSSGANRVNILNTSSAAAGMLVSGTQQQVGSIDGSGNTQVNAGSDLTANHVIQAALIIGGTASSRGRLTIDGSDASGNPLGESMAQPNGLALTESGQSNNPFASRSLDSQSLASATSLISGGDIAAISSPASAANGVGSPITSVPESSTLMLSAFSVVLLGWAVRSFGAVPFRSRRCLRPPLKRSNGNRHYNSNAAERR